MALTSKTRALIAVAVFFCLTGIVAALYLYSGKQPLPAAPAPARTASAATPSIFSRLPPGAPVIGYANFADLRGLRKTPLASMLGLAAPGPAEDREYRSFVRETGFDYTRDLDKVAIAFWPANLLQASGIGQNRVLAVAEGRFDRQKIEAYTLHTGGKITREGQKSLYNVPGNPPVAFEFLAPNRILIASGQYPVKLLTTSDAPSSDAAIQARIRRVAGAPIFAVARTERLPKSFYSNFQNAPQLEQLVRSIQDVTLAAQPDGSDIRTVVDAQCSSLKNALYLSTLLDTSRVLGRAELSDPKVRRQMTRQQNEFLTGLLKRAKVDRQGHWVRLTFQITPAMLSTRPAH